MSKMIHTDVLVEVTIKGQYKHVHYQYGSRDDGRSPAVYKWVAGLRGKGFAESMDDCEAQIKKAIDNSIRMEEEANGHPPV